MEVALLAISGVLDVAFGSDSTPAETLQYVTPRVVCYDGTFQTAPDGGTPQCAYDVPMESLPALRVHQVAFQGLPASIVVDVPALPFTLSAFAMTIGRWMAYGLVFTVAAAWLTRQWFIRAGKEREAPVPIARPMERRAYQPAVAPSAYYR